MYKKTTLDYRTGKISSTPVGFWENLAQRGLEVTGIATRWLSFLSLLFIVGFGSVYAYNQKTTLKSNPMALEKIKAKDSSDHYFIEYYVDNKRYVRELDKKMLTLINGTAKDFNINPSHLLSLCLQEGTEFVGTHAYACSPTAVGDNGTSFGAFQINTKINNVSVEDAKHPYFSIRWTAERLLAKGYRHNPKYAMQCHNSCSSRGIPYGNRVWQIAKTVKIITPPIQ